MSTGNSPNLRCWGEEWGGALDMAGCWKMECFLFATEGSYWITIANVKRKRIPNNRGSYRKTSRAKTCTDTRNRQQISVRWTQCTSWSVMFKNRVQISRLSGVDTRVVNIAIQVSLSLVSAIHLEYRHEYCQYFLQQVSITVSPILFQPKLRY